MKITYWRLLIGAVLITTLISFLFVFRPNQIEPYFLYLPVVFWSGIGLTVALVVLTYIGYRIFPFKEKDQ